MHRSSNWRKNFYIWNWTDHNIWSRLHKQGNKIQRLPKIALDESNHKKPEGFRTLLHRDKKVPIPNEFLTKIPSAWQNRRRKNWPSVQNQRQKFGDGLCSKVLQQCTYLVIIRFLLRFKSKLKFLTFFNTLTSYFFMKCSFKTEKSISFLIIKMEEPYSRRFKN